MKKLIRFLSDGETFGVGLVSVFAGLAIGFMVSIVISVGYYDNGAVPATVAILAVLTPTILFPIVAVTIFGLHKWATKDDDVLVPVRVYNTSYDYST